jgi:hypothetical protein
LGTLLSPLQLVYLSLQALQFQPFGLGWVSWQLFAGLSLGIDPLRRTALGFASLGLQPVCLDAFLAPPLPLEPIRFLGCSPSPGLDPLGLLGPGTFGSQLSCRGAFGFDPFGLAPLHLNSRLLHALELHPVGLGSIGLKPRSSSALPLCGEHRQIDRAGA